MYIPSSHDDWKWKIKALKNESSSPNCHVCHLHDCSWKSRCCMVLNIKTWKYWGASVVSCHVSKFPICGWYLSTKRCRYTKPYIHVHDRICPTQCRTKGGTHINSTDILYTKHLGELSTTTTVWLNPWSIRTIRKQVICELFSQKVIGFISKTSRHKRCFWITPCANHWHTVDGRNPAPPGMYKSPYIMGCS